MKTVSVAEASRKFSRLINAVEHGETILIQKRGVTVAQITAPAKPKFQFDTMKGQLGALKGVDWFETDEEEIAAWEGGEL